MSARAAPGSRPGARFAQFKLVLLGVSISLLEAYLGQAAKTSRIRGVRCWQGISDLKNNAMDLTNVSQSSLVLRFVKVYPVYPCIRLQNPPLATLAKISSSKDQFDDYRESTIGAAFLTQTISLDETTTVKFEIWDTAGQERYKSLAPMYYRNANCAVVVYDITQAVRLLPLPTPPQPEAGKKRSKPSSSH